MSAAPAPAKAPRRRGRPPDRYVEVLELDTYTTGPLHRSAPVSDEVDPARAAWVEALLRDPAAARCEALEQRLRYWRARIQALEARLRQAEAAVAEARRRQYEDGEIRCTPPAVVWALNAERLAAWADVAAARARLAEAERELAGLGQA